MSRRTRRLALAVVALAALAVPATAAAASPNSFHSPTGNIRCTYVTLGGSMIHCATMEPQASAWLSYSGAGHVYRFGPASQQVCWRACTTAGSLMRYGAMWWHDAYGAPYAPRLKCQMERDGVTCWNDIGHGFWLSRQKQMAW